MKRWLKQSLARTSAALICTGFLQTATAGVLDLLRGEPAEPQRVAFVGSAEIKNFTGRVQRLSGIDRWNTVTPGTKLQPGDIIRSQEGTALLQMKGSQSFVKVTPNTIVRFVPMHSEWDSAVLSGREEKDGFIVRSCRGIAFVEKDGRWQPLEVNTVIARGTEVRTSPRAVIDLFDTQSKQPVRIQGPARLTLDENVATRRMRTAPNLASATR